MDETLPQWLTERLAEPLPGPMAGSRFEARPWLWPRYDTPPADTRMAAVLLMLYRHESAWHLPLTLRPGHLSVHAGQVSLPGGAVEPGESTCEAALREYREELGDDQPIDLLGTLSPRYVTASNFLVVPWVGVAADRPRFAPDSFEVEEVIELPLTHLLDPACFASDTRYYQDQPFTAPCFVCQSHRIWGATCMILGEFAMLLEEATGSGKAIC